jgi:N-acylneuraminate cytidylyltransferase
MEVLAIIPARGGSKGIKRKNLVEFLGKPLVAHSIEHAIACKSVTRVVVSTDDDEIASVSRTYGADLPFMRPADLSRDEVLDWPVFAHALTFLETTEHYRPDIVVHLRPTTPYRKPEWITAAVELLMSHPDADSVRSVSAPAAHPYRMFTIGPAGYLESIMAHVHPEPYLLRRQDLPKVYHYNCVIDVTRPTTVLDKRSMTGSRIFPYIMNPDEVLDIDSPRDVIIGETLVRHLS